PLCSGTILHFSCVVFFFSSRRRHTRFSRDWSSDVCSSDLGNLYAANNLGLLHHVYSALRAHALFQRDVDYIVQDNQIVIVDEHRSEERRVGKECRGRIGPLRETSTRLDSTMMDNEMEMIGQ